MKVKTKKSGNRTLIMAYLSLGILIFTKILPSFRHLIGFKKGYAPHNFAFNGLIYDPLLFFSFALAVIVTFRTIKNWTDNRNKYFLLGLITPAMFVWIIETIK